MVGGLDVEILFVVPRSKHVSVGVQKMADVANHAPHAAQLPSLRACAA